MPGHPARGRRSLRRGGLLNNLGRAYAALGEAATAIDYYQQSLALYREVGIRRIEAEVLYDLGNAYYNLGEGERAIAYYE